MVWIGLIWLMILTSGKLLWTRYWTAGFHKMLGNSSVAAHWAASQEGLSSMSEWVNRQRIFKPLAWILLLPPQMYTPLWHNKIPSLDRNLRTCMLDLWSIKFLIKILWTWPNMTQNMYVIWAQIDCDFVHGRKAFSFMRSQGKVFMHTRLLRKYVLPRMFEILSTLRPY
jgi:hypothetical protein